MVVTDVLASLVGTGSLQSATPSQGTCVPPGPANGASITVNCNLGSLLVGASATVTIVVRPSRATTGNRTNTATVNSQDVGDPDRANNSGSVTSVVTAIADVTVAKSAAPNPVQAGTPLTYTLTASNAGPSTAANVVATDTLPADAAFLNLVSVSGGGSCITPAVGTLGGTLTCTWASITSGAQQTAQFRVRPVTGATSVQNNVVVTTTTQEFNPNNNTATITTPVTNAAVDILVNKVDSIDPVALGQVTTYTVTTTNGGPSFATSVQMVDTFPAGGVATATFSYQGGLTISPPGMGTCTEPALNATSGVLTCTFPGLASGQSAVVTYDMRAESISSGISGTTFNRAVVSANEPESLPNNNTTVHATTTRRVADLALVKSAPATVTPGTTFDWTLTVTNNGPNPSTGAVITDTLPAGVTFQSASPGCGFAAGVVSCTLGTLASGANTAVTINVLVSSPYAGANPLLNSASVATVNEVDPVPGNNTGISSSALAVADLQVVKTVDNAQPVVGGNVVFSVVATNNGPDGATGVVVNDLLPAGYVYVTSSATQGSYASGTGVWTVGSLASGASATLSITATVAAAGPYGNTAVVSSPVIDPVPGNNTSTATPSPLAPPTLAKGMAPASIVAGGNATLTLSLGNPNGVAISLAAAFTDTMPAGVTTASGNTGTCTGVTVTPTSIAMASGSTLPPGGCTIIVSITSTTPGTVTNITGPLAASSGTASPASAPLTVTVTAPTHSKTILPATIASGGSAALTLTLANINAVPLTLSAPYTDVMPAGVTLTSGSGGTCVGVTTTPTTITMAAGTAIPPGGCTILARITSSTPGTVTNTTSDLATNAGVALPATAPLTVTAVVSDTVKTIIPAAINAGGVATLTISLSNANAAPLTLTAPFMDIMPAGMTTTSANTGSCSGVAVTAGQITLPTGSTIAPGGCTIMVQVTSSTPGTVTNTTSSLQTSVGISPPASAPLTVSPAKATLTKTIAPATISVGGTATLTLTLGNPNALPITLTAAFVDNMPSGLTTASANTGTCTGVAVTSAQVTMASGATIPAGGCTIVVTVTSSTPGTVINTTGDVSTSAGVTPGASAPLTVTPLNPGMTKTILPATITSGGTANLTITLGNANPIPVTLAAAFTDTMPAGVTTTSGNTGSCTAVTVTPTSVQKAAGSTIPPGGCTVVVTVTSSTPGTVINTTGSLQTNAGVTTPASAPLTVLQASASLSKTILPGTIIVGGATTLTLTLGNANATPIILASAFTDPMPAGVTTTSANTGSCSGVTVTPTMITMASGANIPAGGCTIVVTLTSSTPGKVTNVTSPLLTSAGPVSPANAPLTVSAVGVTLGKAIAPATIVSGGTAMLTLTLGNATANALTLTSAFTDTMPAGVTTTSANSGSCVGVTVTPTTIAMASGTSIPAGGCTIVVTLTSSTIGTVTNVTSPLQTGGGTVPAASAPLTVTVVGVSLGKAIAPATIVSGGTAMLTLTLGNATANALTLTSAFIDTMPAGVTTTSANTGTCTGVTVTPTTVTMASGTSIAPGGCTIVATITSSTIGTVTNVTGPLQTGGGTAPAASAPITVTQTTADLAVTKTNNRTSVTPGSVVTYVVVVTNNGPAAVTGATVADVVPSLLTGVNWTCSASAGSACPASGTGNVAAAVDLLAGGTVTFILTGTLSTSTTGTLTNTATVTAPPGVTDPAPGNNSSTDVDPIAGTTIDLAIAKTNNGIFTPGQTGAQYTIVVSNVGTQPTVGTVTVTDILPAGLTATAIGGTGWNCTQSAGPCSRDDVLAPGASYPPLTLTVNIAHDAPSPLTNVATLAGGGDGNPADNSATNVVDFVPGIEPTPIPVNTPVGLALLLAMLAMMGAWQLRGRRR